MEQIDDILHQENNQEVKLDIEESPSFIEKITGNLLMGYVIFTYIYMYFDLQDHRFWGQPIPEKEMLLFFWVLSPLVATIYFIINILTYIINFFAELMF